MASASVVDAGKFQTNVARSKRLGIANTKKASPLVVSPTCRFQRLAVTGNTAKLRSKDRSQGLQDLMLHCPDGSQAKLQRKGGIFSIVSFYAAALQRTSQYCVLAKESAKQWRGSTVHQLRARQRHSEIGAVAALTTPRTQTFSCCCCPLRGNQHQENANARSRRKTHSAEFFSEHVMGGHDGKMGRPDATAP